MIQNVTRKCLKTLSTEYIYLFNSKNNLVPYLLTYSMEQSPS